MRVRLRSMKIVFLVSVAAGVCLALSGCTDNSTPEAGSTAPSTVAAFDPTYQLVGFPLAADVRPCGEANEPSGADLIPGRIQELIVCTATHSITYEGARSQPFAQALLKSLTLTDQTLGPRNPPADCALIGTRRPPKRVYVVTQSGTYEVSVPTGLCSPYRPEVQQAIHKIWSERETGIHSP